MKKYILLFILLTCMGFLKAQQEVIVYSSLTQTQLIGKQIAFLEDEEGKLTIEDIQKENYQKQFQKNDKNIFASPPSKIVIWVKATIQNQKLKIIKADRNSVGGNFGNKHQTTFTTNTLYITEPTRFYIYSDGYQDQFGGENDKKYTTKRFLQTLQESSTQEYALQSEFLDKQFKKWKGKNKRQLDDVLVIGFEMIPN